jgi:excisionase family DNA binding protein
MPFDTPSAPVVDMHRRDRSTTDAYELMTVTEVAALLKVSKSWVYEHTRPRGLPRADRLPHLKIGKYVRFDPESIRQFIARQSTRA